jgi:type I restriction enzyme, S subunit
VTATKHSTRSPVPTGYKQTEVGVIPEEWDIRPLGLICDVRDGTHESPRFFKDGVPFVTSKNIVDGCLDLVNVSFISKSDAVEFDKRSKVERDDILLSMIGTIGSAVVVDCEPDFCIKNVALIKPRKVAPTYLICLINSPVFQKHLADNLDGGIQKFISLGKLRQLSIPLPDEPEQRAIAEALSDVDGLLGALDRLIAKKRDLKQAAMQQLLTGQTPRPGSGQARLPGFDGEWEVKRLGELLTICHGRSQHEVQVEDGPYPILATGGQIGTASRSLYDKPSVLIGRKGTIDQPQYMDTPFWTVDTLFYSSIHDDNNAKFLFYRFCLIDWKQHNEASGVPSLNARTIEDITIRSPQPNEQTAIAEVLSEMDAELAALDHRREKTRALKQGMMQELLTGRIRLVGGGLS